MGWTQSQKVGKPVVEGRVAESWELSAIPGSETKISNGVLQGQSIVDVIKNTEERKFWR